MQPTKELHDEKENTVVMRRISCLLWHSENILALFLGTLGFFSWFPGGAVKIH